MITVLELPLAHAATVKKDVLIVECNRERRQVLAAILALRAGVEIHSGFAGARQRLLASPPHILVTSSRLGAYNGLHLAHLAASVSTGTRVIVYGDDDTATVAREVKFAGAFFVLGHQIAAALTAYLDAELPPRDRRDAARVDRRQQFRGGRRITDINRMAPPADQPGDVG
jgi:DNA-binding NtrC family response regulator